MKCGGLLRRHKWSVWGEPRPYPGRFSSHEQLRTCGRCNKQESRCY